MRDILANPEVSTSEAIFGIVFAILVGAVGFATVDIILHDIYVLPLVANCWFGNENQICDDVSQKLGNQGTTDQLEFGKPYWFVQSGLVLLTGFVLASFRIFAGYYAGARNYVMLIFVGFMWFLSGVILFFTGWIDTLYYVLRGMDLPATMPWLNDIGLFQYFKWFGNPNVVQPNDLILLNITGLGILILFWVWIRYHHVSGHLEMIGIK